MRLREVLGELACLTCLLASVMAGAKRVRAAEPGAGRGFDEILRPVFTGHCIKCHGGKKPKGDVDLAGIESAERFLARPELIRRVVDVIEEREMPPRREPRLGEGTRLRMLAALKALLREAVSSKAAGRVPIRRLNRFQYNNAVRDLFALGRDVFALPEKLMTRHSRYLDSGPGRMPDRVEVACHSLSPEGGLEGVGAFPRDLRAAHGYDNQADQLTLSPLLLDAFLKLSVSIVESRDFNRGTVGIWDEFFEKPPDGVDLAGTVRRRIAPFLDRAFRRKVDAETIGRYTAYALSRLDQGLSFTDSMKKVASAVLSSPFFLYRYHAAVGSDGGAAAEGPGSTKLFELASDLSFFLWGSGPDAELLEAAESGELSKPERLEATIDRMLADPKIERFLDSFPAQWMQLDNILAAAPDPGKQRFFSLDPTHPASLQMVLEPLLLFDAVFLENRSIVELIAPSFAYRSDFLRRWYASDLTPPEVDESAIAAKNREREGLIRSIEADIEAETARLAALDRESERRIEARLARIDLSAAQARWEAEQTAILARRFVLSTWRRIGPFAAASFDDAYARAFLDESAVHWKTTYGKLRWDEAADLTDGRVHRLTGTNCATYLARRIDSGAARSLDVSLGSDDGFKLWLNGELVAEKKVLRGVAPDQDKVRLALDAGENRLLLKVVNGGGGYGFYFKTEPATLLPAEIVAALKVAPDRRTVDQRRTLSAYYRSIAPELADIRRDVARKKTAVRDALKRSQDRLRAVPGPFDLQEERRRARQRFDDEMRRKLRARTFERVIVHDRRYGGAITNAAVLTMTSGPRRTHPIARGKWLIEVIFNDPPPPPPNNVPPLKEDDGPDHLTIRERFAQHRADPTCAGCHSRIDPLGFALENFDLTGRWRDTYENGRGVDASGVVFGKYYFDSVGAFKSVLVKEKRRFAKAFIAHVLRFALSRELVPADALTVDEIVEQTERDGFRIRSLIRAVILSDGFLGSR